MGRYINYVRLFNVLDEESDILVDLKFSDVVTIHVSKQQRVIPTTMESKGNLKNVLNTVNS